MLRSTRKRARRSMGISMITATTITVIRMGDKRKNLPLVKASKDRVRSEPFVDGEMPGSAALYRLMTWLSPSYPVGAFSYSSGIEWAVEAGDIKDAASLSDWLTVMI